MQSYADIFEPPEQTHLKTLLWKLQGCVLVFRRLEMFWNNDADPVPPPDWVSSVPTPLSWNMDNKLQVLPILWVTDPTW